MVIKMKIVALVLAAGSITAQAQSLPDPGLATPAMIAPTVTYSQPDVTYATPTVTYYQSAPVTTYYQQPIVTRYYYSQPVQYYQPPVRYYRPPSVQYNMIVRHR